MKGISNVLEFNKIKESLINYSRLPFDNPLLINITPLDDYDLILNELDKSDEGIKIVRKLGHCSFDLIHDIKEIVIKAYKGGVLSEDQLYKVGSQYKGIDFINTYYNSFKVLINEYPNFVYHLNSLFLLKNLSLSIDKVISPELTILDNASLTLSKIRKDIINKSNELRRKIDNLSKTKKDYLQDNIVTIRNDRYVIPVKNAYKNMVKGIIHDESSSKESCFIEPEEIVIVNNELSLLKIQEKEEIERLLRMLSLEVAKNQEQLLSNLEHLIELDFILSKGSLGLSYDGIVASLSKDQIIDLRNARHPLIDPSKVISNNFSLNSKDRQIYLITGPNTGGKTVGLKTVGLLVLMNQAGLAIPVSEATLGLFYDVFVDIGDDQNISESLSTFSSHLSKLINMVKYCNGKSLILVDEIGGGTDPKEGEALAMALLEEFHNKHSLVLASTHYHNLKTFGLQNEYVVNASMTFDIESLKPTYKLVEGVSGRSYALEIASSLNLPLNIIDRAKYFKDKFSDEKDKLIEKVEREENENIKLKEELDLKQKELDTKLKEVDIMHKNISLEKEKIKNEASEEVNKLVNKYKEELDEIMHNLRNNDNIKLHNVSDAKASIKNLFDNSEDDNEIINHELKVNDNVKIDNIDRTGKIMEIKNDYAVVLVNGKTLKVKLSSLTYTNVVDNPKNIVKKEVNIRKATSELNLIGFTVAEALPALEAFLSNALAAHLSSVRIIHGYGTGKLREAVHTFLKKQKYIKDFHYGGPYDGLMGATIVELK